MSCSEKWFCGMNEPVAQLATGHNKSVIGVDISLLWKRIYKFKAVSVSVLSLPEKIFVKFNWSFPIRIYFIQKTNPPMLQKQQGKTTPIFPRIRKRNEIRILNKIIESCFLRIGISSWNWSQDLNINFLFFFLFPFSLALFSHSFNIKFLWNLYSLYCKTYNFIDQPFIGKARDCFYWNKKKEGKLHV